MDVTGFALVTGAASGIGKVCANAFATEGAAGIALLDISQDALEQAKADAEGQIRTKGVGSCRVLTYVVDIWDENKVDNVIEEVAKSFGRLDYVVNAAGIVMKHEGGTAYCQTQDWQRVLNINLSGTFYVLRASARIMLAQEPILSSIDGRALQRGSIVNFASIQALAGFPNSTAYNTSKAAVLGLTRTASEDYAKDGLRINAVCPGYIATPMTTQNPAVLKVMQAKVATAVPMQRMGRPQEIADAVLYLAGGRSSFVTGTALIVDGGYLQR